MLRVPLEFGFAQEISDSRVDFGHFGPRCFVRFDARCACDVTRVAFRVIAFGQQIFQGRALIGRQIHRGKQISFFRQCTPAAILIHLLSEFAFGIGKGALRWGGG